MRCRCIVATSEHGDDKSFTWHREEPLVSVAHSRDDPLSSGPISDPPLVSVAPQSPAAPGTDLWHMTLTGSSYPLFRHDLSPLPSTSVEVHRSDLR